MLAGLCSIKRTEHNQDHQPTRKREKTKHNKALEKETIIGEYPSLFENKLGKLKNYKVKLNIDDSVVPVYEPHRSVPHSRRH